MITILVIPRKEIALVYISGIRVEDFVLLKPSACRGRPLLKRSPISRLPIYACNNVHVNHISNQ